MAVTILIATAVTFGCHVSRAKALRSKRRKAGIVTGYATVGPDENGDLFTPECLRKLTEDWATESLQVRADMVEACALPLDVAAKLRRLHG